MIEINQQAKHYLKLLGIGILAAIVLFVLSNSGFFWQNLKYYFSKPKPAAIENTNPQAKSDPDILQIPSLGIRTPVVYVSEENEKVFQTALIDGVVHYPSTANPGEVGNDYIFGHSSDYIWSKGKYKSIFAILPKIAIGEKIYLTDHEGNQFIYIVTETKIVAPNDLSVLNQDTAGKKILTVQTSYPVGTALKRFVVIAELK